MAPHPSTLAWKIPWTEEPGGPWSMGSLRVRQDSATSLSLFTFMHWRRKWQPLQCSCLENPRDGGAWWAAVYGVAQSRTRLKRLSSSSSRILLTIIAMNIYQQFAGNFLVVQWLGLGTFIAGTQVQFPGRGTKIPQAKQCGQKKKKKFLHAITVLSMFHIFTH